MLPFEGKLRKWGGSTGLIIPAEVVRRRRLRPGRRVRFNVEPAELVAEDFVGFLGRNYKKIDWEAVDKELATGWGDD